MFSDLCVSLVKFCVSRWGDLKILIVQLRFCQFLCFRIKFSLLHVGWFGITLCNVCWDSLSICFWKFVHFIQFTTGLFKYISLPSKKTVSAMSLNSKKKFPNYFYFYYLNMNCPKLHCFCFVFDIFMLCFAILSHGLLLFGTDLQIRYLTVGRLLWVDCLILCSFSTTFQSSQFISIVMILFACVYTHIHRR
jgi:hypothetical protein